MAAPSIPNLNTLLTSGRGRGVGRGRGRGSGIGRGPFGRGVSIEEADSTTRDGIIQQTDQDAAGSRLSAVQLGYLKDDFAATFSPPEGAPRRRYPIINRGTYVRTTAIDGLIQRFLSMDSDSKKQIICLGAGTDTRFFRLASEQSKSPSQLVYHEFDFPANTKSKIERIKASPSILSTITATFLDPDSLLISADGTNLQSPTLNIHALDLRSLASQQQPLKHLPNLSPDVSTLILSECCLVYFPPDVASSILTTIATALVPNPTPLALLLYEPILPNDPFGRTMMSNLASRGIDMPSLARFPRLVDQRGRLRDAGFVDGQRAADIKVVWDKWIGSSEKERVARCEMLDELEEWHLLASHYCLVWGWRGDVFGRAWADLEE